MKKLLSFSAFMKSNPFEKSALDWLLAEHSPTYDSVDKALCSFCRPNMWSKGNESPEYRTVFWRMPKSLGLERACLIALVLEDQSFQKAGVTWASSPIYKTDFEMQYEYFSLNTSYDEEEIDYTWDGNQWSQWGGAK